MEYIDSRVILGKYMAGQLDYEKGIWRESEKTVRGFKNLRWKEAEASKVNEYLKKYTIRTESGEDRIALEKLVRVYREKTEERINNTKFMEGARKYGYKLKAAAEEPYYYKEGKKKKKEGKQEIKHCITKLKWLPGAMEEELKEE